MLNKIQPARINYSFFVLSLHSLKLNLIKLIIISFTISQNLLVQIKIQLAYVYTSFIKKNNIKLSSLFSTLQLERLKHKNN